ncbi:hypothetical protein [Aurantimonas sp. VKM B-3413]|uniref:hypothetical protein n=1 Tax=Aurantimonas sp. VKM B-3413 TaxID=2779401 RepID=UPI001E594E32|nr:hypothetical protein [Aurantimonas sp. VKM B-3413]MCB8837305.1 hypothetical protein [Aurantimonas sp. VKM B-3413]
MLIETMLLASSLAIPFGDNPPVERSAPQKDPPRYETSFEFAEIPGGYALNAIVVDLTADSHTSRPVAKCRTIDLDSFQEALFGTPVLCNGVSYTFDVRKGEIVVDAATPRSRPTIVKHLAPGHAVVNGMTLLIEASR